MLPIPYPLPEHGQLVRLRNRFYLVQDVVPHQARADMPLIHHVTLDCLDDDQLGQMVDVLWECEIAPTIRGQTRGSKTPPGAE